VTNQKSKQENIQKSFITSPVKDSIDYRHKKSSLSDYFKSNQNYNKSITNRFLDKLTNSRNNNNEMPKTSDILKK
jgi:hypothetical protein